MSEVDYHIVLMGIIAVSASLFIWNVIRMTERALVAYNNRRIVRATWKDIDRAIDTFLVDYDCLGVAGMGVDGAYTPNAHEKYLIKDALSDFLSEPKNLAVIAALIRVEESPL